MVKNLIPRSGFSEEIIKYYFSPNLIIKNSGEEFLNLYCFIAKVDAWPDENNVPQPENSDSYLKTVYKNLIALKKVNSNNICPVIKRIDWIYGTVYNQYSTNSTELSDYYVRNSYDQVFKCLYNGTSINNLSGSQSTIQPLIDFSTNFTENVIETGDGYKWKYLYTIDVALKLNFFDENWMPIPILGHRQSIQDNKIGCGEISVINVYNPGNEYFDDNGFNQTTKITITGDGVGAEARAVVSSNQISKILMTSTGSNYTYADAIIEPRGAYSGNSAILIPEISPIGGHGYNFITELGCKTVMIISEFNGTESGVLPYDIDYRQIGLITNPEISISPTNYEFANAQIFRLTHNIVVSGGSGVYQQDEIVYQGDIGNPTFSGIVLNFDATNNLLYLINTTGTVTLYQGLFGTISNTTRVLLQETIEQIVPFSGNIIYLENRTKVQRTSSGLEQFRLTLNY